MPPLAIAANNLPGANDNVFMQAVKHSAYKGISSTQNLVAAFNLAITMAGNRK